MLYYSMEQFFGAVSCLCFERYDENEKIQYDGKRREQRGAKVGEHSEFWKAGKKDLVDKFLV